MNRLLSKSSNRRLNLISILQKNNKKADIKHLSMQLACSERTLKEDIAFINTNYKTYLSILFSNNTVYIKLEPCFSYESILKKQIKDSLAFTLLEEIFLNEEKTIDQLSESLYASPATLYRHIKNINSILNSYYNITLQTNPCCLVGEEANIRNFYTQLFSDMYDLFEWPFGSLLNEKALEKFISSFLEQLPLMIDFAYFRNIKIITGIHIIRYKKGYRLKNNAISRDGLLNDVLEKNDCFPDYSKQINLDIDLLFLREIYSDFIVDGIAFSSDELIHKAQHNDLLNKSYFGLLTMLNQLSRQFHLKISNKEIMITNLNNTIFLAEKELYSNFIIYDKKIGFLEAIELEFPQFYVSLKNKMTQFLLDVFNIKDTQLLNTLMYTVLTHWHNLMPQLLALKKEINVLILSHSDFLHSTMIKDILVYKSPEYINFEVKSDICVNIPELAHSDYDIIISTFSLGNLGDKKNLCIEHTPTQKDMSILRKMVDEILLLNDLDE